MQNLSPHRDINWPPDEAHISRMTFNVKRLTVWTPFSMSLWQNLLKQGRAVNRLKAALSRLLGKRATG